MDQNADIIAGKIESRLMHYECLIQALAGCLPIQSTMLYLKRQSVETNLVLLRQALYASIECAETLLPALGISIVEWRATMNFLEESYATLEKAIFSRAALLADCQEYRATLLGDIGQYTHDSQIQEMHVYWLSNTLSIRTWLAYLLDYLYQDDPPNRAREIQALDAALLAHMPRSFVQWLGSWDDHGYRCMELEPVSHWWCYREGYAAQNYDFG